MELPTEEQVAEALERAEGNADHRTEDGGLLDTVVLASALRHARRELEEMERERNSYKSLHLQTPKCPDTKGHCPTCYWSRRAEAAEKALAEARGALRKGYSMRGLAVYQTPGDKREANECFAAMYEALAGKEAE